MVKYRLWCLRSWVLMPHAAELLILILPSSFQMRHLFPSCTEGAKGKVLKAFQGTRFLFWKNEGSLNLSLSWGGVLALVLTALMRFQRKSNLANLDVVMPPIAQVTDFLVAFQSKDSFLSLNKNLLMWWDERFDGFDAFIGNRPSIRRDWNPQPLDW